MARCRDAVDGLFVGHANRPTVPVDENDLLLPRVFISRRGGHRGQPPGRTGISERAAIDWRHTQSVPDR